MKNNTRLYFGLYVIMDAIGELQHNHTGWILILPYLLLLCGTFMCFNWWLSRTKKS